MNTEQSDEINNNEVNWTEMITKIERLRCDDVMNNNWINNGKNTSTTVQQFLTIRRRITMRQQIPE